MPATTYSPQGAAAVSGAPLAAIQKAITTRKIPARVTGTAKRRQLDETALLAFALVAALPAALRLSPVRPIGFCVGCRAGATPVNW
jgi:hypothetical protein